MTPALISSNAHGLDSGAAPIFIVGMPRSGTKLLRELLNGHSEIYIPDFESHFIPHYARHFSKFSPISQRKMFEKFYAEVRATTFGSRMIGAGDFLTAEEWFGAIKSDSYADTLSALYLTLAKRHGKNIWGDKTPLYLTHLPVLISLFPLARIIHVIRDGRDQSLSEKKAWGKHLIRAAQRWSDAIVKCRNDAKSIAGCQYHELRYESLTAAPEIEMRAICRFLNVDYQPSMLELKKPTERLGDARGNAKILSGNSNKWRTEIEPRTLRRMEQVAGRLLNECGYEVDYQGEKKRIPAVSQTIYQLHDAWNVVLFNLRHWHSVSSALKGIRTSIRFRVGIKP